MLLCRLHLAFWPAVKKVVRRYVLHARDNALDSTLVRLRSLRMLICICAFILAWRHGKIS